MKGSLVVALLAAALIAGGDVHAHAAANDDFASAETITLPYSTESQIRGATREPNEPDPSCVAPSSIFPEETYAIQQTQWFRFTATTDTRLMLSARLDSRNPVAAMYKGDDLDALVEIDCDRAPDSGWAAEIDAGVRAGDTVTLQVGFLGTTGGDLVGPGAAGRMVVRMEAGPEPITFLPLTHDDMATPLRVGKIPYFEEPRFDHMTSQPGEPTSCVPAGYRTLWYEVEMDAHVPLLASLDRCCYFNTSAIAVHEVLPGGDLALRSCDITPYGSSYTATTFAAEPGRRFLIQVGMTGDEDPHVTTGFWIRPADERDYAVRSFTVTSVHGHDLSRNIAVEFEDRTASFYGNADWSVEACAAGTVAVGTCSVIKQGRTCMPAGKYCASGFSFRWDAYGAIGDFVLRARLTPSRWSYDPNPQNNIAEVGTSLGPAGTGASVNLYCVTTLRTDCVWPS